MRRYRLWCVVPDYVLRTIAERGNEEERRVALEALATSVTMRSVRAQAEARRSVTPRAATPDNGGARAGHKGAADPRCKQRDRSPRSDRSPGERRPEQRRGGGGSLRASRRHGGLLLRSVRPQLVDKSGMPLEAVVHYRERYDNALWNGTQMIFGDGSGLRFTRLTQSLTVSAHEMSHGIIQYDGPLVYEGGGGRAEQVDGRCVRHARRAVEEQPDCRGNRLGSSVARCSPPA
jgi:Thermolysin metallopeptidase, catalytic domain